MVELLAPVGDMEKLEYAIHYGADALYLAGKSFGLRAACTNFDEAELEKAVKYAQQRKKKVYVTVNIFARNYHIKPLYDYFRFLESIGVDGAIISDVGVLSVAKEAAPNLKISLSTQASTTNYKALEFWHKNGVDRVILARELSFEEIKTICLHKPKGMSVEVFVHGAMCISYSGRCLISSYMTGRESNLGDCAQSCRWKYALMEETREGEYFPVEEDENGTYFFNSKDLCLIDKIPELIDAGVDSFKIEGRMKSLYYVSTIVNAYRAAIDAYYKKEALPSSLFDEVSKVSHRAYTHAFYEGNHDPSMQNYGTSSYLRGYDFIGIVREKNEENSLIKVSQRNKFSLGDSLEVISPGNNFQTFTVMEMYDEKGNLIESAPHAQQTVWLKADRDLAFSSMDILRKKNQ